MVITYVSQKNRMELLPPNAEAAAALLASQHFLADAERVQLLKFMGIAYKYNNNPERLSQLALFIKTLLQDREYCLQFARDMEWGLDDVGISEKKSPVAIAWFISAFCYLISKNRRTLGKDRVSDPSLHEFAKQDRLLLRMANMQRTLQDMHNEDFENLCSTLIGRCLPEY